MFTLAFLVDALAQILSFVIHAYMFVLVARAVLSWIPMNGIPPMLRWIYAITDPILDWLRDTLRMGNWGIDLTPMLVLLALWLIDSWLVRSLRHLAGLIPQ